MPRWRPQINFLPLLCLVTSGSVERHSRLTELILSCWKPSSFLSIALLLAGGKTVSPLSLGRDTRIARNPETHTQYVQSQISRPDSGVPLILSSSCPTHNTFGHVDLEEKTVLSGFCCVFSSALPVSVTKTPVSTSQWELESSVKLNSLIPNN